MIKFNLDAASNLLQHLGPSLASVDVREAELEREVYRKMAQTISLLGEQKADLRYDTRRLTAEVQQIEHCIASRPVIAWKPIIKTFRQNFIATSQKIAALKQEHYSRYGQWSARDRHHYKDDLRNKEYMKQVGGLAACWAFWDGQLRKLCGLLTTITWNDFLADNQQQNWQKYQKKSQSVVVQEQQLVVWEETYPHTSSAHESLLEEIQASQGVINQLVKENDAIRRKYEGLNRKKDALEEMDKAGKQLIVGHLQSILDVAQFCSDEAPRELLEGTAPDIRPYILKNWEIGQPLKGNINKLIVEVQAMLEEANKL